MTVSSQEIDNAFAILNNGAIGLEDEPVVNAAATVLQAREENLLPGLSPYSEKIKGTEHTVIFPTSIVLPTRRNCGQTLVIFRCSNCHLNKEV